MSGDDRIKLDEEISALRAELDTLSAELKKVSSKSQKANQLIIEIASRIEMLTSIKTNEKEILLSVVNSLRTQVEAIQREIGPVPDIKKKLEYIEKHLTDISDKLTKYISGLETDRERNLRLKADLEDHTKLTAGCKQQCADYRKEFTEKIDTLETDKVDLENRIKTIEDNKESVDEAIKRTTIMWWCFKLLAPVIAVIATIVGLVHEWNHLVEHFTSK